MFTIRRPIATLAALVTCSGLAAQYPEQTQEELRELRRSTLAKEVFRVCDWYTDFDAAQAAAEESGKPILAYFTRSYTPDLPAQVFENVVLRSKVFREWADRCVLFVHVTSYVDDEPYPNLLADSGGKRLPWVAFLDHTGRAIARPELAPDQNLEFAMLQLLYEDYTYWRELRDRVRAGEEGAERELYELEVELGILPFDEAYRRFWDYGYDRDEHRELFDRIVELQFRQLLESTPPTPEAREELGRRFLVMFDDGRVPHTRDEHEFWRFILFRLYKQRDVERFREVVDYIREHGNEVMKKGIHVLEQQLQKLESGAAEK